MTDQVKTGQVKTGQGRKFCWTQSFHDTKVYNSFDLKYFCNWTFNGPKISLGPKLISDETQTKMHLRIEFNSGVGPTCFCQTPGPNFISYSSWAELNRKFKGVWTLFLPQFFCHWKSIFPSKFSLDSIFSLNQSFLAWMTPFLLMHDFQVPHL